MARAGIGPSWKCLFANDFDPKKAAAYAANWGDADFRLGDINDVSVEDLPGSPDLVWASFPCQDLSLAGGGAGLKGERSGTFWPFWERVVGLAATGRKPKAIVLENVTGMLTSHRGRDFAAICKAVSAAGYQYGAVVVDAAHFVPQSRKRVFIVGISDDVSLSSDLSTQAPHATWQPPALQRAVGKLDEPATRSWIWWRLPDAPVRNQHLVDIVEAEPHGVEWHSPEQTNKLLSMMSEHNVQKLRKAKQTGRTVVGTIYRRTRPSAVGGVQRAEIRLDGTAGCLRTPAGGSSRQIIMVADQRGVRSRLISPREAARMMGLPDSYQLPTNYNEAYHLLGDGLAVPAVSFVIRNIVEPALSAESLQKAA